MRRCPRSELPTICKKIIKFASKLLHISKKKQYLCAKFTCNKLLFVQNFVCKKLQKRTLEEQTLNCVNVWTNILLKVSSADVSNARDGRKLRLLKPISLQEEDNYTN